METPIQIGYWKTKRGKDNYPVPVPDSITDIATYITVVDKLIQCFIQVSDKYTTHNHKHSENIMDDILLYGMEIRLIGYRDWSNCRICCCKNGSKELQIRKNNKLYVIPEGYLHYLIDHKVGIDDRLVELFDI